MKLSNINISNRYFILLNLRLVIQFILFFLSFSIISLLLSDSNSPENGLSYLIGNIVFIDGPANIRKKPNDKSILTQLESDLEVKILEVSSDQKWYKIQFNQNEKIQDGWTSSQNIQKKIFRTKWFSFQKNERHKIPKILESFLSLKIQEQNRTYIDNGKEAIFNEITSIEVNLFGNKYGISNECQGFSIQRTEDKNYSYLLIVDCGDMGIENLLFGKEGMLSLGSYGRGGYDILPNGILLHQADFFGFYGVKVKTKLNEIIQSKGKLSNEFQMEKNSIICLKNDTEHSLLLEKLNNKNLAYFIKESIGYKSFKKREEGWNEYMEVSKIIIPINSKFKILGGINDPYLLKIQLIENNQILYISNESLEDTNLCYHLAG